MKQALIFWFTGLSGSGKTTVALASKCLLEEKGFRVLVVDGDEFRGKRHPNLGFTEEAIKKNNEQIAQHCDQERGNFDVILVPIISPYHDSRQKARKLLGRGFYEIYFNVGLECVMLRDTKGLYQKARNGEIGNLIGYSQNHPYEAPKKPDLIIPADRQTPEESSALLSQFIFRRFPDRGSEYAF